MGFVAGALVQAIPEPQGMRFTLCDENISRYSELSHATAGQNGKLIQVIFSNNNKNYGPMITTSGQYLLSGGLSIGDRLIVQCRPGLIRMRKAPGTVGAVGSCIDRYTGKAAPVIRLCGQWLAEAGFVRDALAVATPEPGCITLDLHDRGIEQYSLLVKHARENKLKLVQIRQYYKNKNSSFAAIKGQSLAQAGFGVGDLFRLSSEYGLVRLQKLDLKSLGF